MIGVTELVVILSVAGGLAAIVFLVVSLISTIVANRLEGRR
jgi:hypothetical protein